MAPAAVAQRFTRELPLSTLLLLLLLLLLLPLPPLLLPAVPL